MNKLDQLLKKVVLSNNKNVIAVAVAQNDDVLLSIDLAYKKNIATSILYGDEAEIRYIAQKNNIDLTPHKIVHEIDKTNCCNLAVSAVRDGYATALMKGLVDTSVILKSALNKEHGLRKNNILSHLAVFELPTYHKLLFVTDSAINITPDLITKKNILDNSLYSLNNLGIKSPKVAGICAKEKVNPKMQSTVDALALKDMYKDICLFEGPIALDSAISKTSAITKGIYSEVAGDADLLLVDNIEAGNALYKSLSYLSSAKNGGVVLGAKNPIILTSRSDNAYSKLVSIALGLLT